MLYPISYTCSVHVGITNGRRASGCAGAEALAGISMAPRLQHPPFTDFNCSAPAWRRALHVAPFMMQPWNLIATREIVSASFACCCSGGAWVKEMVAGGS